jgi:DNA-binding CsgD family transcriptional regulator
MLPAENAISQILAALYEAPLDSSKWEIFLRQTAEAIGGEAAALLLHDFGDAQSLVARQWQVDPDAFRSYGAHYSALDVWFQAVSRSPDWLGTSEQFVPFAQLERSEFYNDLILPAEIPHGIFAMVERSPSRVANLSIYRSARAGAFDEQDLPLIRFLKPHIERAYRLHSELAASRNHGADLQTVLNSMTMGVILLAPKGHIVATNRAAERVLAENNGLRAGRDGLRTERADESAHLLQLVAEATATSAGTALKSGGVLTVSRRGRSSLQLLVSPVLGFDVDETHPVRAIVFISDPARRSRPAHDILRALFGLTPAECRVAMLVADGLSPTTIAEMLGVSRNTLKSQLTSIYQKTGVGREAQLVRLLLQLPATDPSIEG